MFISKKEKNDMNEYIKQMSKICDEMKTNMLYLIARVKVLEGEKTPPKKPRKQSTMSAEGRAKISAAVKAYHAKKKLERENATSISTTSI